MSREEALVAWYEVPGTAPPQESRPVGYGVIRAGVRADSGKGHYIEQQFEQQADTDLSRRVLGLLKKQGAHFDQKYRWD